MTPEEKRQFEQMKKELAEIKNYTSNLGGSLEFKTLVQTYSAESLGEGSDITAGNLTINNSLDHDGSTIGFFGTTPATQQPDISAPTGGSTIDSEARTAINSIRATLDAYGLTV